MPVYTNRRVINEAHSPARESNTYSDDSTLSNSPELRRNDNRTSSSGSIRTLPYLNINSNFITENNESQIMPVPQRSVRQSYARRHRLLRRPRINFSDSSNYSSWGMNWYNRDNTSFESRNITEDTFLSEINRISARSLLQELPNSSSSQPKDNSIFYEHLNHKDSHDYLTDLHMDQIFDKFLSTRRINGSNFNKSTEIRKKKRKFNEINDEEYLNFKFDNIRPIRSSFFKNGVQFKELNDNGLNSISFLNINFDEMILDGYLSFKDNESKLLWFHEHTLNKYLDNTQKTCFLTFTGEIIDFEKFDLRYKTLLQQNFDVTMQQTTELRSQDFQSAYQNCIIRKQLSRWTILKPFKNMTIKSMQSILTCEHCLENLQKKFILLKLFIKNGSIPDLLVCINKELGSIEIIPSESKSSAVAENISDREINNRQNKPINMFISNSRYSSASIGLS